MLGIETHAPGRRRPELNGQAVHADEPGPIFGFDGFDHAIVTFCDHFEIVAQRINCLMMPALPFRFFAVNVREL